jgi:hypothetical protein
MFICQKLEARTFFYLIGIEVFSSDVFSLVGNANVAYSVDNSVLGEF